MCFRNGTMSLRMYIPITLYIAQNAPLWKRSCFVTHQMAVWWARTYIRLRLFWRSISFISSSYPYHFLLIQLNQINIFSNGKMWDRALSNMMLIMRIPVIAKANTFPRFLMSLLCCADLYSKVCLVSHTCLKSRIFYAFANNHIVFTFWVKPQNSGWLWAD